ncbi:serine/threonine-protein kinase [Nocardia donostiensis]|uniref:non-specific serine/threonine protein kinase n=1 Tax=Nocardia donostiensis TaxID=1538463 RepID=A0A1W0B8R2_9NOCA|nr:serine/threonine-protein kinase [Nocardia donostiensis]ONM47018.1 hypothetical protein B0T46_20115 [Nocardia donostiensis]OQS14610.1 hypothetical protein B0T36_13995 [Nocardia donostiensis]OQS18768.1 hypothetical protein B0T44_17440 [Nocardia donostiensis]
MGQTRLGRYRLDRLLGKGGMGEVWLAFDTATARRVVLKLLPIELAGDQTYRKRFGREAELAARLRDPHIVPIHTHGDIDGRLFIEMEFIEGLDLARLLRRDGPLPPAQAVDIVAQTAAALDAAHRAGLVHRDVKPSNIVVRPDGFAYLIDFGIAYGSDATAVTTAGLAIGTWAYMAPERFTGRADARSDVYSLGCVLYECLTGARPFGDTDPAQQMHAHLTTDPPSVHRAAPEVAPALDAVIARALAKDPDERYATAGEFAHAARAAQAGNMSDTASSPLTQRLPGPGSAQLDDRPSDIGEARSIGAGHGVLPPTKRFPEPGSGQSADRPSDGGEVRSTSVGHSVLPSTRHLPGPGYARTAAYTRVETGLPLAGAGEGRSGRELPDSAAPRLPVPQSGAQVAPGGPGPYGPQRWLGRLPGARGVAYRFPGGYGAPGPYPAGPGQRRVVFSGRRPRRVPVAVPPRRRKKTAGKVFGALLVILLAPCVFGAGCFAVLAANSDDAKVEFRAGDPGVAQPGLGDPVRDGKLEFVVTKVETGIAMVGVERAEGAFTVIGMTVRNISAEPKTYLPLGQQLYDTAGRRYDPDVTATAQRAATAAAPTTLQPGESTATHLVFGVPVDSVPAHLTVRDFPLSQGTRAPLR